MAELKGFPIITQIDGDINQYWDCVPASIAAGLQFLTGRVYHAGTLKDVVYGVNYQGGTAANAYVDYCAQQGVILSAVEGSAEAGVLVTQRELEQNHPVLFTEIDPYSSAIGVSHVVVACECTETTITVIDPYIAQGVTKTLEEWAQDLLFNEVWVMQLDKGETRDMTPLTANEDDKQLWAICKDSTGKAIPLNEKSGIGQSWLQARWHRGLNFGPPLEQEHAIQRGNVKCIEQQFSGARAQWTVGGTSCVWWFASGSIRI